MEPTDLARIGVFFGVLFIFGLFAARKERAEKLAQREREHPPVARTGAA